MHSSPCIAYAMAGVPCINYMETTKITLKPKDKQVLEEKLKDLLEFAQIHRLPCFVSFVTGNTEKGTTYGTWFTVPDQPDSAYRRPDPEAPADCLRV